MSWLDLIENRALLIRPFDRLEVCTDPKDNIFLECAEACRADYLITGNKRHFPAFWKMTKAVTGREFLSIIAPHIGP